MMSLTRNPARLVSALTVALCMCAFAACSPKEKPEPEKPSDPQENTFKEEPDDNSADPAGTFNYAGLKALGHPRLLMTGDDFEDLKTKLKNRSANKVLAAVSDHALKCADKYVGETAEIKYELDASGKRLLAQSRKALQRLFACAYAYKVTGRSVYLKKAQEDLRVVCHFRDWHPSHFLDVAEMSLGVAITYDWLYHDLPYEDRVLAHKAMKDFALNASYGKEATFRNSMNNWNQVCNCGVVAAALAVYEKDKAIAAKVIEDAITSNMKAQKEIYSPDGNYGEGYGYWDYGTGFETILLKLLKTAFGDMAGLDQVKGFYRTGSFMLFMASPAGKTFPFADGGSGSANPSPGMWWFASELKDPSMLLNEYRLLQAGKYSSDRLVPAIPCFILKNDFNDISTSAPDKDLWYGRGLVPVAMIHTGWKNDASDYYVAIKGGAASANHAHMDAGEFIYESQGVRWSDDLIRQNYTEVENPLSAAGGSYWNMGQKSLRWDVYRLNNLAHSTLSLENNDGSIDKLHPTDHFAAGSAAIEETYESSTELGVKLNMSAPLKGQVKTAFRTVRLVDGKDLKIEDEITALDGQDAVVQWRMLTPASVVVDAGKEVLTMEGKTLCLRATASDGTAVKYTTWAPARPASWTPRTWDQANTGYTIAGYTITVPAGKKLTLTTLLTAD